MPFAGIDIGSTMTKVVIADEQEKILASHIGPTGAEHRHLALKAKSVPEPTYPAP